MISEKRLKALLDKYLSGQLTSEESDLLESWFTHKQTTGRNLFDEAGEDNSVFKPELFNNIIHELGIEKKRTRFRWWAAASILLIAALGGIGYWVLNQPGGGHFTSNDQISTQSSALLSDSLSWKTIVNSTEKTQKFVLSDGSKVSLYPNSSLKYDSSLYNVKDRRLYLSGKGFFDVAHDAQKPFIVYSRGISTMALGTAFRISGYANGQRLKIELIRGKIRIRQEKDQLKAKENGFKEIVLNAGEYFSYDFAKNRQTQGKIHDNLAHRRPKKQVDVDAKDAAKAMAAYNYDREVLSKVLEDMEAAYHVEIDYNKKDIDAIQFSGSITPGDNIQHILKKIGLLNDLKVTQMDKATFRIDKIN